MYEHLDLKASYDSMRAVYTDDRMTDLHGYTAAEQDHLQISYYAPILQLRWQYDRPWMDDRNMIHPIKYIARLDRNGDLIGVRTHYDPDGQLVRTDRFLVPYKEEELVLGVLEQETRIE